MFDSQLEAQPKFVRDEVEYLGHLITPAGLKPNECNLAAVREFPVATNLKHLRQFLGLTSHYRHFIHNYAKIAHPLYALTIRVHNISGQLSVKLHLRP